MRSEGKIFVEVTVNPHPHLGRHHLTIVQFKHSSNSIHSISLHAETFVAIHELELADLCRPVLMTGTRQFVDSPCPRLLVALG